MYKNYSIYMFTERSSMPLKTQCCTLRKMEGRNGKKGKPKYLQNAEERNKRGMVYGNRYSSVLLFKAKTDTLPLNYKNRHTGGDINCVICGEPREDRNHFLLDCPEYSEIRSELKELQQPYEEDRKRVIGKLLFEETNLEKKKEVLQKLWEKRRKIKEIAE